jgi:formylglycine-generating enzyme required for sulfatase activity
MHMLRIPAGMFRIGDDADRDNPVRKVTLATFYFGAHEVTVAQFMAFYNDDKCPADQKPEAERLKELRDSFGYGVGNDHPVTDVDWEDAFLFCNWLSRCESLKVAYSRTENGDWQADPQATGYRLPTEEQWECACRAGSESTYHFGNNSDDLGNSARFNSDSADSVGRRRPNGWGLFDMYGNAREWCENRYGGSGSLASIRVERGGCWASGAVDCRSAFRGAPEPAYRYVILGFRVAAVPLGPVPVQNR